MKMEKNYYFQTILLALLFVPALAKASTNKQKTPDGSLAFSVSTQTQENEKIKCQSLIIGKDKNLIKLGKIIKFDLNFTDQLNVNLKRIDKKLDQEVESKLFETGTSLCLYISKTKEQISLDRKVTIELRDISSNSKLFEKMFNLNPQNIVYSGHKISEELLQILTGEKGICLNSIVYTKMISPKNKKLCVSDYACMRTKKIKTSPIPVAPRLHPNLPIIYFSQLTPNKIILKSYNTKTKTEKIMCSYDGLNMQPSFSEDGTTAAVCLSGGGNSNIYLYKHNICKKMKKRVFIKLTHNNGNNVSPCLISQNGVIFCSDFETGLPQIYYINCKNKKTTRLTNGSGYCAAPSYCAKNKSIVYTRLTNGIFQLFKLSLKDLRERQLTFGKGHKHEPDFSPDGKFVAFSYDDEIAILNCNSGKFRVITHSKNKRQPKNFPRWSKIPIFS